jgi:hypothetical protein
MLRKHLLLLVSLGVLCLAANTIGGTQASFIDQEASSGNSFTAWTSELWTQTTQQDFEAGVLGNVDTSSNPGNVELTLVPNPALVTQDNSDVSTGTSSSAQLVKTLSFTKSGPAFNEIRIDSNLKVVSGTSVTSSIRLNDVEIFTHTTTSSTYVTYNDIFDFSSYADGPYTLKLYLTVSGGNGYNSLFELYTTSPVLETSDNSQVSATDNTKWQLKKTLTFTKNGSAYNNLRIDTNLRATGNTAYMAITIDSTNPDSAIISHDTDSTSYVTYSDTLDFSGYADGSHTLRMYLKIGNKNRQAYNSKFEIWRTNPTMVTSNNNEYSVSGTLDWQLMKILTITKDGPTYDEIRVDSNLKASATAYSSIRVDDVEKTSHETTSTTYVTYSDVIDLSSYADGDHTIKLYMKSSNKNQAAYNSLFEVYRTKTHASSGTIASQVWDTGVSGARWDGLIWDETLPTGTDITFEVRASNTPFDKSATSPAWVSVGGTSPVISGFTQSGRYLQWRATLTPDAAGAYTPVLQEVRLYYH